MLFEAKKARLILAAALCLGSSGAFARKVPEGVKDVVEAHITSMMQGGVPPPQEKELCVDKHKSPVECKEWAWFGECEKNPGFMAESCKRSCGFCTAKPSDSTAIEVAEDSCTNHFDSCTEWAEKGNIKVNNLCYGNWKSQKGAWTITGAYVVEFCPKACNVCDIHLDHRDMALGIGLPQSYPGIEKDKELQNYLKGKVSETRDYINSINNEKIKEVCKMSHPHCARYALSSDCDDHKDHPTMKYGCAAACQTCYDLVNDNGIAEAKKMWENALRDYSEKGGKAAAA